MPDPFRVAATATWRRRIRGRALIRICVWHFGVASSSKASSAYAWRRERGDAEVAAAAWFQIREQGGQNLLKDWCLLAASDLTITSPLHGPVAQLIERIVRNDEVVGLIPIWSTILRSPLSRRETYFAHRGFLGGRLGRRARSGYEDFMGGTRVEVQRLQAHANHRRQPGSVGRQEALLLSAHGF